jgi:CHAD domain-containing protein
MTERGRGNLARGLDTRAQRVVASRVRLLLTRRADAVARGDPDSVHDVRVATRRLQEALDLFAPMLPARERERLRRRARRVRRHLAQLRDADVIAGLTTSLPEGGTLAPDLALAPLTLRVQMRSRRGGVRVPGIRRRAEALAAAFRARPADAEAVPAGPIVAVARQAMQRRAAAVGAALRGVRVGRAADVHRLRLAVKKYRYMMELIAQAGLATPGPALEASRRVQEALGRLHDLDVLLALLRRRKAGRRLVQPLARARRARADEAHAILAAFRPWSWS